MAASQPRCASVSGWRRTFARGGRLIAVPLLALGLALPAGGASAAPSHPRPHAAEALGPVGWDVYRHPERMAELTPGARSRQFSSFDRTGGNDDGGTYSCLHKSSTGCVLAEHTGPGEIDSIWFTRDGGDVTRDGNIIIELDGRTVLNASLADVTNGKVGAPFVFPLVANADQSSGGASIKVPMPFRSSMRVTVTPVDGNANYYHVGYRRFATADGVSTFNPADHADDVIATLKRSGTADPKPPQPGATTSTKSFTAGAGQAATVYSGSGSGLLTALKLTIPGLGAAGDPASNALLRQSRIRVDTDGRRAVDAPLGEFFGTGLGLFPVHGLMFGVDPAGKTLTCWWPMPYGRSVSVSLLAGPATLAGTAAVTAAPAAHWATDLRDGTVGYFHGTANQQRTVTGQDYPFLTAAGRGRVVGVSHSMTGLIPSGNQRDYLEGDERVYADGTATPDVQGTGTEDFYESGWYFNHGTYTNPFTGNPSHLTATAGCQYDCTGAYRLMPAEGPAFGESMRFGIEHGPNDEEPADYASTTFWYGQDGGTLRWTDELRAGDAASEKAHGFGSPSPGPVTTETNTFDGRDGAQQPVTLSLRSGTAPVTFTLATDPGNGGVSLRRVSDQDTAGQVAAVSVDGKAAGTWTEPLGNATHRFLDDEFVLPASLTAGKKKVTVTLAPPSGAPAWSAARYQALSVVAPFADAKAPGAVAGVRATGGDDNSVTVAGAPTSDDVYQPTYQVYGSTKAGFTPGPSTLLATGLTMPGFQHTGLGLHQTWYYRVRAVDAAGHAGGFSAQASATTGGTLRVEGESLLPAVSATAPVSAQGNCCGVQWSGGAQLWFQAASAPATVTVNFTLPSAGDYSMTAVQTLARDYGIDTLAVDGTQVGGSFDAYHADTVAISPPLDYGTHHWAAGRHTLTLTVTGRNAASVNDFAGLDYLTFKLAG